MISGAGYEVLVNNGLTKSWVPVEFFGWVGSVTPQGLIGALLVLAIIDGKLESIQTNRVRRIGSECVE